MSDPYDWRREFILIDVIDSCPICSMRFPFICSLHSVQTQHLAIQRQDAAGSVS